MAKHHKIINIICFIVAIGMAIYVFISIFPPLDTPLFWDELGVYGRSVWYLLDNTVSILPGDLPPDLSRGHPMLFVFLTSFWMNLFGETLIVGHLFMLLISVSLVISTSFIAFKLTKSKTVGLIAGTYLFFQVPFMAQSELILPEVMLALFIIWAFYFLLKEKMVWYALFASLALLTKETAIIVPAIGVAYLLIKNRSVHIKSTLLAISPYLTFAAFLCIQKIQNGWFLFPYHTGLIHWELDYITTNFSNALYFLCVAQGRIGISVALFAALIFGLATKTIRFKPTYLLIGSGLVIVGMLLFSSINFYMNRYFMLLFPFIGILVGYYIVKISTRFVWVQIICFGLLFFPLRYLTNDTKFNYDVDLGYLYTVHNLKRGVQILEQQPGLKSTDKVYCDFPANFALKTPKNGYLGRLDSLSATKKWDDDWKYALIVKPSSYEVWLQDKSNVKLVHSVSNHFANVRLYKRK